mgnify:FL=1
MRARRVRARALIARASITLYSIVPRTNAQPTASPCRSSLPTTTQAKQAPSNSYLQHTTTAARGKCSRLRSVQVETTGKISTRAPLHTNGKPQQAGRVTQKIVKSSETCKKTNVKLQKWGDVVYFIWHNVNDIHPKMQEPRQNERPPPILQDQDAPKIGERPKHFPL